MRFVGLDYGRRRIGVAVSDSKGAMAVPVQTFTMGKDRKGDLKRLAELIEEYEPAKVIVGMPVGLSGHPGPSAEAVRSFVRELSKEIDVEFVFQDERFSTMEASRLLREANISEKSQRSMIDASAAAVILQAWLDKSTSP